MAENLAHEALKAFNAECAIREYRKARENYVPSAEEMYEMQAAFGPGAVVVDVITGQRFQV